MKKILVLPSSGLALSMALLATGLPFRSVSPDGVAATIASYVLCPLLLPMKLLAPSGAHELEHSFWPVIEYPVAATMIIGWWVGVGWLLARRSAEKSADGLRDDYRGA